MLLQEAQALSDQQVVERVRGGETGLYELLMRRYNQKIFRVIRSVIPNDLEAEDVLQDAWVRAYQHLDQFEGRSSFPTWVARIAWHEALARMRREKRWTPLEDANGGIMPQVNERRTAGESPEGQAIRTQLGRMLETAVDGLPEAYRSVFVMREVEQLSTSETAECLGLSEETVKIRLHRARATLRRELTGRIGPAVSECYTFMGAQCDRTVARVMERITSLS